MLYSIFVSFRDENKVIIIIVRIPVENTYHDTNQTDKASHKEIASSSPAVL